MKLYTPNWLRAINADESGTATLNVIAACGRRFYAINVLVSWKATNRVYVLTLKLHARRVLVYGTTESSVLFVLLLP